MGNSVDLQSLLGILIFASCMAAIFVPLYLSVYGCAAVRRKPLDLMSIDVELPSDSLREIDKAARNSGVSRSEFVVRAVLDAVERRRENQSAR